jgi:putative flippase GtrA
MMIFFWNEEKTFNDRKGKQRDTVLTYNAVACDCILV